MLKVKVFNVLSHASSFVILARDDQNKIIHVRNTGVGSPIRQMLDMARDRIYKEMGIEGDEILKYDCYIYSTDGNHVVGFNPQLTPIHVDAAKLYIEFISDEHLSTLK